MPRQINYRMAEHEINDVAPTESWPLGTRGHANNGRTFRRAKAGTKALAVGTLVRKPENEALHSDLAVAAGALEGTIAFTATLTGAGATPNEYADGLVYVNDGPGQGYAYEVTASSETFKSGTITITIHSGLIEAVTTSSRVTLVKNRYDGVRICMFNHNEQALGLVQCAVPANYHFWLQTAGPGVALQEGALFENAAVAPSGKIAGAAALASAPVASSEAPDSSLAQGVSKAVALDVEGNNRLVEVRTVSVLAQTNVVGYCLDPRVDGDYALIAMTLE